MTASSGLRAALMTPAEVLGLLEPVPCVPVVRPSDVPAALARLSPMQRAIGEAIAASFRRPAGVTLH